MNKEWCPYCHAMTYEDIYGHCCACGGSREKSTKISDMSDEELYLELEHLSTAYLVDLPSGTFHQQYDSDDYSIPSGTLSYAESYLRDCTEFYNKYPNSDLNNPSFFCGIKDDIKTGDKLYQAHKKIKVFFRKALGIK